MKRIIYADNAATTELDKNALEAMNDFFLNSYGNPSQPYSFSRVSKKALRAARKIIADCINADEEEIFFTSGGTESDNWALICSCQTKKQIITDVIEHHAVLRTCEFLSKQGNSVIYLDVNNKGLVSCESLEQVINNKTAIVSIMLANNEIGTIEKIRELCEIAHSHNALFHTDAVQAVGHIKVDVKELGVDLLSASAHKFNGPKGIGFLYIKKGTPIHPLIYGGKQEFGLRAGTENVPLIVGMARALQNNCTSLSDNQAFLEKLENAFLSTLLTEKIDFIVNGHKNHLPGLINISIRDMNGETILHRLDLMGCYISTGSACDSVRNQVSHVVKAIRVPREYSVGTIRISFGKNNSIADSKQLALNIAKLVKEK